MLSAIHKAREEYVSVLKTNSYSGKVQGIRWTLPGSGWIKVNCDNAVGGSTGIHFACSGIQKPVWSFVGASVEI